MAVAAAKPEVFTRNSSGLVRVMSPYSAFVYNILTMGLIFPWTYLWAPGALPGGRLVWGILLAMIFEIPIALYLCLAVDGAAALRRRLCVPEPGVRWRRRLLGRDVGLRHLDPAMGRAVRLAAFLPRLRLAVFGARRDHGQPGL